MVEIKKKMKDLAIKQELMVLEARDYLMITLGIFVYCMGWAAFLLPYQIATGGVAGISAIIFYATGFPVQDSYFILNVFVLGISFKFLSKKFIIKTSYAILAMTFILWVCQELVAMTIDGKILGDNGQDMACVIGASICGLGMGIVFINNGSTGGTDVLATVVNKYKDIGLGRMLICSDVFIISSCYFVFHSWARVVYGLVTLVIIGYIIDSLVNGSRSSVQFLIISKKYDEIADAITKGSRRGVTFINAQRYYSKEDTKIVMVLARKRQSIQIFRTIKTIDPEAFISQSQVIGVYGEGFDVIKA